MPFPGPFHSEKPSRTSPRSAPSAAAEPLPPPPDDFERLLTELSAEYERLRKWSSFLVRENGRLRSKSAGLEVRPLKSLCGVEGEVVKAGRSVPVEAEARPWRTQPRSLTMTAFAFPRLKDQGKVEGAAPGGRVKPVTMAAFSVGLHGSPPGLVAGKTVVPTSEGEAHQRGVACEAHLSNQSSTNVKLGTLAEQFHRIAKEKEVLRPEDLIPILEEASEPIDYDSLVGLVRVSNGKMPYMDQPDSPPHTGEEMGIDFHAWRELMEETNSFDNLGPKLTQCIQSLRSACLLEQTSHSLEILEGVDPAPLPPESVPRHSSSDQLGRNYGKMRRVVLLEVLPTMVILLNAVFSGVTVDFTGPEYDSTWDVLEVCFFAFYSFEFGMKLWFFGCRHYFCGPDRMWNIFDSFCLAISLPEMIGKILYSLVPHSGPPDMGPLLLIKIFRLTRLARPLRTLRFKLLHELKLIVMGVFSGLRVLLWAIALLTVLTYLVGVATTLLFKEQEPEFGSVTKSMFTLFRCWTDGCEAYDGTPLAERLRARYGLGFVIFHVLISTFVTIGVFNLIMAIFIDNVVTAQAMRRHAELGQRTHEIELKMKRKITQLIRASAPNRASSCQSLGSGQKWRHLECMEPIETAPNSLAAINREWSLMQERGVKISRELLNKWLLNEDFQYLLEQAEIETANTSELFDVLDADMGGNLSMDELITGLMKLRGPVTKADIVAVRLKVRNLIKMFENETVSAGG